MKRSFLLYFIITITGLLLIARLFQLQVIRGSDHNPVQNAAVKVEYTYPERGYIYDRNGILLVANQLSYDVMIVPKEVTALDTLEFCSLLKITKDDFKKHFQRAKNYAPWLPSVFLKQLAKDDFAFLQEKLHKFKGFYIQKRSIRNYPIASAANVLGYISEVNESETRNNSKYQQGELIGTRGVEKQYDSILRGIKGKKYLHRDRLNKIIGSYKDRAYDTLAINGQDIFLTIDSKLQQYGELLMQGKRGGIVALEPSSGEILALISAPTYNPNRMVGRQRAANSVQLFDDTHNKPMFDRGLQATYSPGSPFKIINALIGLQEGVINKQDHFLCYKGFRYGNRKNEFMGCHCGTFGTPIRLQSAIVRSCNTYFSNAYIKIINKYSSPTKGMDVWSQHVKSFGLGNFLGYDLPSGRKGLIPNGKYYDNRNRYRWGPTTNISNAIGQGEILTTPIQLANVTAAIANKGFFYTPHILKKTNRKLVDNPDFTIPKQTTIDSIHFTPIIEAMHRVFKKGGTGQYSQVRGIEIAGKTGTVENFTKINGVRIQQKDHSILIAFAPKDNPKIAIAVFVENGGYGSTIAAPIASLLIEKYINKKVLRKSTENSMINLSLKSIYDQQIQQPIEEH